MPDRVLARTVLLQDLLLVLCALGLAHAAREWALALSAPALKPSAPVGAYLHLLLIFLPSWTLGAQRSELHRIRTLVGPLVDVFSALLWTQAWGALAMALILVAAQAPLNRSFIGLFLVISTGLLVAAKPLQRSWVRRHRGDCLTLIVGEADPEVIHDLERIRGRRVELLEDHDPADLRRRIAAGGVDEVILAAGITTTRVTLLLDECATVGVATLVAVQRGETALVPKRAEFVGDTVFLLYQQFEDDRPALFVKAAADRVLAALGLLLVWPLLLLVAALVKLTSPGPVLFIQPRGGLNGRPFPMLKFRTMRIGAEAERIALLPTNEMDGPVFKMANDPRVTALGRVLRRTSIDELPQLVNVLLGHMSIVGPRPLPVMETREITGIHRRRLSMRPGITCLWQISGRNELGFEDWMALDVQYVERWSLSLDFAILLRTLPALISGRGAV